MTILVFLLILLWKWVTCSSAPVQWERCGERVGFQTEGMWPTLCRLADDPSRFCQWAVDWVVAVATPPPYCRQKNMEALDSSLRLRCSQVFSQVTTSACLTLAASFPWSWWTGGPAGRCWWESSSSSLAPWHHFPSSSGDPIGAVLLSAPPPPSHLQGGTEGLHEISKWAGLPAGSDKGVTSLSTENKESMRGCVKLPGIRLRAEGFVHDIQGKECESDPVLPVQF